MITRLSVYDMDGTLINTPLPDYGRQIWKDKTGEEYPHVGWWGRPDSLNMEVFDINPFPSVVKSLDNDMNRSDTYTVILTSRLEKLRPQVERILDTHSIKADEILLKQDDKDKDQRIQELINKLPDVREVHLYDDREKEFVAFKKFKDANPQVQTYIYKADNGNVSLFENNFLMGEQIREYIDNVILDELRRLNKNK